MTLLLYSEGYDVRGVWSLERINLQNYELICKKGDEDSADSQTFDIAFNEEPLSWEVHGDGSVMMNGEKKCSNLLTENDVTHINVKGGDIKLEVTPPTGWLLRVLNGSFRNYNHLSALSTNSMKFLSYIMALS